MYVTEFIDRHVEVTYVSAHTGHELGSPELPFLPLPESTKEAVSQKISLGIPTERILDGKFNIFNASEKSCSILQHCLADVREDIGNRTRRDDFNQTVGRKHYLTRQDVSNIKRKLHDNQVIRHQDDATSVSIRVAELQQEPFNPILLFKPQGEPDSQHPTLSIESFILIMQTEFQMQLYRKYAHKILCIDSTHCTNAYRFKLISCLVQDEFGSGWYIVRVLKVTWHHTLTDYRSGHRLVYFRPRNS